MVLSGHLSSEWLTHKVQFDWMARASSTTAAAIATRERGGHRHAYINQIIRSLFGSFSNTTECRRCLYSYFYMRISSPITSLRLAATPQFPTQVDSPPQKKYSILPQSRCSGGHSSFTQTIHMTEVMGQPGTHPWKTCPRMASDPEEIQQAGDRASALFTLEEFKPTPL